MTHSDGSHIYLSDADLAGLGITTDEIISAIEETVAGIAKGEVWTTPKAAVMPGDGRYMMATLAASDGPGVVAVKTVMVSPDNPSKGLPGINGAIVLLDSQTGVLVGVIGANWVTAVRTAGLSAVMAKRLANPASRSIAFVGTGVQAHSHLDAFSELFELNEVRVLGRGQANIDKLCDTAQSKGMAAVPCLSAQDALEDVDIVVSSITLNYEVEPFLDARWLKPGAFAAVTDLAIPWEQEGMPALGSIYVDDLEQEKSMEKPMVPAGLISGDLKTVVCGETPAQFDPNRSSAFVFRGLAAGDLAVAGLAYQRARSG